MSVMQLASVYILLPTTQPEGTGTSAAPEFEPGVSQRGLELQAPFPGLVTGNSALLY